MTTDRPTAVHAALAAADRRDRMSRAALYAAALIEVVLLGLALMVMDFDNDTHLLIFITGILVYSTLGLGLAAIAARASASDARLLHAIQLLDERRADA
jgi:K+-sensing histidine kinase KdpD